MLLTLLQRSTRMIRQSLVQLMQRSQPQVSRPVLQQMLRAQPKRAMTQRHPVPPQLQRVLLLLQAPLLPKHLMLQRQRARLPLATRVMLLKLLARQVRVLMLLTLLQRSTRMIRQSLVQLMQRSQPQVSRPVLQQMLRAQPKRAMTQRHPVPPQLQRVLLLLQAPLLPRHLMLRKQRMRLSLRVILHLVMPMPQASLLVRQVLVLTLLVLLGRSIQTIQQSRVQLI